MENTNSFNWKYNKSVLIGYTQNNKTTSHRKVLGLDMDGTLIQVKSGAKFPKDANDWLFFHPTKVIETL